MTTHLHEADGPGPDLDLRTATAAAPTGPARPRWLLPGLAGAVVVGALVLAGAVSLSTVLYAGLIGGMLLMHVGGHGHGGHGHGGHGSDREASAGDLSEGSSDPQPGRAGSSAGLDRRADDHSEANRTHDDDRHPSHGCH